MEIITFALFLLISFVLIIIGFFLEETNPYLILTGSMIIFLVSMSLIAEGLEIPTGDVQVNLTISPTNINGTITDVQEVQTGIRSTSFNLVLVLLSLYLAYYSIGEIIKNKYGEADVD